MPSLPVDTSLTGYTSGSVDRQDAIYRNRQRPQPYPLLQNDSGYETGAHSSPSKLSNSAPSCLLSLAHSAKCHPVLSNEANFVSESDIECYESDTYKFKFRRLDDTSFQELLSSSEARSQQISDHRVLIFFTTLNFAEKASFKAQSSFSKVAVENLLSLWNLNALFVFDLLGRPDYWAPEVYSYADSEGNLERIDFFCQQPRFVIHSPGFKQRSPVSIYMNYDAKKNITYYIISGPESEECIQGFKNVLDLACLEPAPYCPFLQHPLEAHITLSKILFESSQGYMNLFRQSMFAQLRAVDELAVQETTADRKGLANVTIELQIISKDVNKLIGDVNVALRNLAKTQETFARLENEKDTNYPISRAFTPSASAERNHRQQLVDMLQYLHASMDKQKMWLQNYRDRKDIAISLVFNLVTQQDAANNIMISKEMKRDSSSMNGIALLTMVFLPGTFTSTLLGAGLFSAIAQNKQIHVSSLWWFWAAITFPLTGFVLFFWGVFCWRKEVKEWWACHASGKWQVGKNNGGVEDIEAKG